MEILKNVVTVNLGGSFSQMKRVEYPSGVIDWVMLSPRKEYKLENAEWSIFNEKTWSYDTLTEDLPTWEQEYQEALLAQYPFEKRVREIVENNVDVETVMFKLARDFNFVEMIKKYFKKLPR
jgi:hypothetical protein